MKITANLPKREVDLIEGTKLVMDSFAVSTLFDENLVTFIWDYQTSLKLDS